MHKPRVSRAAVSSEVSTETGQNFQRHSSRLRQVERYAKPKYASRYAPKPEIAKSLMHYVIGIPISDESRSPSVRADPDVGIRTSAEWSLVRCCWRVTCDTCLRRHQGDQSVTCDTFEGETTTDFFSDAVLCWRGMLRLEFFCGRCSS